ncbi:MAG: DegV family protein [Blautia sp.]
MSYQLYTDATADFCPEMAAPYAQIRVIPMELTVGEEAHTYGPGGDLTVKAFYEELRNGKYASTSQINPAIYEEAFRKTLEEGKDILYLCFSSGLSSTYQSAQIAVRDLEEDFPERKIICIDTLCGSVGEGFLVREAARLQSGGYSMENLADWVTAHRLDICHWFTVDMFDHLRHGGRVSAAAAAIGTVLQIKPMLHDSNDGKLELVEKPRGQKKAMALQLDYMKKGWNPAISPLVLIGHGDCPEKAELLKAMVQKEFPTAEIYTTPIGPIIGSHTGPGMLALIYWGTNR